jgi:hypothetical protein
VIDVTVMWPDTDDATLYYDYYLQKHLPMVEELLGDKIEKVEVARGVGGPRAGSAATLRHYHPPLLRPRRHLPDRFQPSR